MILNIDKPNKTAMLHINKICSCLPRPLGTELKPHGSMGRDGGSFVVTSETEARMVAKQKFSQAKFKVCSRCQKRDFL